MPIRCQGHGYIFGLLGQISYCSIVRVWCSQPTRACLGWSFRSCSPWGCKLLVLGNICFPRQVMQLLVPCISYVTLKTDAILALYPLNGHFCCCCINCQHLSVPWSNCTAALIFPCESCSKYLPWKQSVEGLLHRLVLAVSRIWCLNFC